MKSVKVKSYAKINLTLEIKGIEGGFHMLDSLVASVDLFDLILLKKRKDKQSTVRMKGMASEEIPTEQNNAYKAALAFSKRFDCCGADITVYKNIPIGAGLGGSSADVVGVLNGMAKLYGIDDREALGELADRLGSDTRYMLTGGFARMQGRGEKVFFFDTDLTLHFLLLCPETSVSAGGCYRRYDVLPKTLDLKENFTEECLAALQQNNQNGVGRYVMNDLFPAAASLNSDVLTAKEALTSFSPLAVEMTGSGSCVFALFETRELCEWAKSRYRGDFRAYVVKTVIPDYCGKGVKSGFFNFKNPYALTDEESRLAEE